MQDDEKDKQIPISLRQFICYSKKAIQWKLRDFDEVKRFHDSHEFLPEDGNLLDAPSMQKYFNNGALESVFVFIRSDGKGEPMYIHREDLAQAIESLPSTEQDFLIKIFQEELPMSLYAAELGISTSMAYRRKKAILRKLSNAVTRGVDDNEDKN